MFNHYNVILSDDGLNTSDILNILCQCKWRNIFLLRSDTAPRVFQFATLLLLCTSSCLSPCATPPSCPAQSSLTCATPLLPHTSSQDLPCISSLEHHHMHLPCTIAPSHTLHHSSLAPPPSHTCLSHRTLTQPQQYYEQTITYMYIIIHVLHGSALNLVAWSGFLAVKFYKL